MNPIILLEILGFQMMMFCSQMHPNMKIKNLFKPFICDKSVSQNLKLVTKIGLVKRGPGPLWSVSQSFFISHTFLRKTP